MRHAESGGQTSTSGQGQVPDPHAKTSIPTETQEPPPRTLVDIPSSLAVDSTELPNLSEGWSSDLDVMEIDGAIAGFKEPELVQVLEVDELLA